MKQPPQKIAKTSAKLPIALTTPLGKLQAAVGVALENPKYKNSIGGDYQFNYRKALWEKRIEPYLLQHGKGYASFDREAFLATGELVPVSHFNPAQTFLDSVAKGELKLASVGSKLAHFVLTSPFYAEAPIGAEHIKGETEQHIDRVYNKFQDYLGKKRSTAEEHLQEVSNDSIQSWMLKGAGELLPQLPLWYAGGEMVGALEAGLPAVTATGTRALVQTAARKAILDATEGLGYAALDDPDSWKDYARSVGTFAVANPIMRFMGKLIGVGGHEWERKNIAKAVETLGPLTEKDTLTHGIQHNIAEEGLSVAGMEKHFADDPALMQDAQQAYRGAHRDLTSQLDIAEQQGQLANTGNRISDALSNARVRPIEHGDPVIRAHHRILDSISRYQYGKSWANLPLTERVTVTQTMGFYFKKAMERPVEATPELAVPVISKTVQEATGMKPEQAQAVAKNVMEGAQAQEAAAKSAAAKIDAAEKLGRETHGVKVDVPTDTTKPGAASAKSLEFYNNTMQWFRDNVKQMIPGINIERGERRILAMMNLVAEEHIPVSGTEKEQFLTTALYHLNHSSRPEYREIKTIEEAVEQGRAVWHHTKMVEANAMHPEVGKHTTKKGEVTSFGSSMPRKGDKITGTGHDMSLDEIDRGRIRKLWNKQNKSGIKQPEIDVHQVILDESHPLATPELKAKRQELLTQIQQHENEWKAIEKLHEEHTKAHDFIMSDEFQKLSYEEKQPYYKAQNARYESLTEKRDKFNFESIVRLKKALRHLPTESVGQYIKFGFGRDVIVMEQEAMDTLSIALNPFNLFSTTYGFHAPVSAIANIAHRVDTWAGNSPIKNQVLSLLYFAAAHKPNQGVVVVGRTGRGIKHFVGTLREELFHAWQADFTGSTSTQLSPEVFDALHEQIPSDIRQYLERNGYPKDAKVSNVIESAAKIAARNMPGINYDDAAVFLASYFEAVEKTHGVEAFNKLRFMHGSALDTLRSSVSELKSIEERK